MKTYLTRHGRQRKYHRKRYRTNCDEENGLRRCWGGHWESRNSEMLFLFNEFLLLSVRPRHCNHHRPDLHYNHLSIMCISSCRWLERICVLRGDIVRDTLWVGSFVPSICDPFRHWNLLACWDVFEGYSGSWWSDHSRRHCVFCGRECDYCVFVPQIRWPFGLGCSRLLVCWL